jgi:GNAT superfamily N-acetyltransferase
MINVIEVKNWRQLRAFMTLPHRLYDGDSPWVPSLHLQTLVQIGKPFDKERRLYLALDGSELVGRIGVKLHHAHDEKTLNFGFFECAEGYPQAAVKLIEEAHKLAPELTMRGPFNFRMEDPYTGLLVDGFSVRPSFWSSYNPPYYVEYLSQAGLTKTMDLITYRLDWNNVKLDALERLAQRAKKRGIEIRTLDPKNRMADVRQVARVMNEALKDNWGFEAFTEEQVRELALLSYLFLDPKWLLLAEKSEHTAGCCIVLPDYNPWIKKTNGRLTPWLVWKLLFCKDELTKVRAWALGVLSVYRSSGTAFSLVDSVIDRCRRGGVLEAEISWILETNKLMNSLLLKAGAERSRVHRILQRDALI